MQERKNVVEDNRINWGPVQTNQSQLPFLQHLVSMSMNGQTHYNAHPLWPTILPIVAEDRVLHKRPYTVQQLTGAIQILSQITGAANFQWNHHPHH